MLLQYCQFSVFINNLRVYSSDLNCTLQPAAKLLGSLKVNCTQEQEQHDIDKTDDHDPWLAVALVVCHEVLALAVQARVARALVNVRLAVGSCCGTQKERTIVRTLYKGTQSWHNL